jgi:hypothetical protein
MWPFARISAEFAALIPPNPAANFRRRARLHSRYVTFQPAKASAANLSFALFLNVGQKRKNLAARLKPVPNSTGSESASPEKAQDRDGDDESPTTRS